MKHIKVRELFFQYILMGEVLNDIKNNINRYKKNIPFDNEHASEYIIEIMNIEIEKKNRLEKEIRKMKDNIDIILKDK